MNPRFLIVEKENRVARVTLHRPEKKNALSPEVLAEIRDVFRVLDKDEAVNVVVLTGGEKAFCAGFDLNFIRSLEKDSNEAFTALFHEAYRAILFCGQPVIAAVGGPAIAGGFDLSLMCDIRYASSRAKFGQREIALSLTPLLDPLWRIVGLGRAMEVALTGRIYGADEAQAMGYVSRVFPEGELLAGVGEIAETMAGYDRACLRETKRLGRSLGNMELEGAMKVQEWLFRSYIGSEDNHQRVDGLLESLKRK
ncbi:MAG: enoyl-CoA hydratase/isomerase family protein [Proteobacteria bacterium]|nr:enoyl-CoA hydratase/isomerase family protein [Pseudomonadota bacterium]